MQVGRGQTKSMKGTTAHVCTRESSIKKMQVTVIWLPFVLKFKLRNNNEGYSNCVTTFFPVFLIIIHKVVSLVTFTQWRPKEGLTLKHCLPTLTLPFTLHQINACGNWTHFKGTEHLNGTYKSATFSHKEPDSEAGCRAWCDGCPWICLQTCHHFKNKFPLLQLGKMTWGRRWGPSFLQCHSPRLNQTTAGNPDLTLF